MQHLIEVKFGLVEGAPTPGFTREVVQPGISPERVLGRNRRGCSSQGALILPDLEVCYQRIAQTQGNQGDAGNEKGIAKQRGESTQGRHDFALPPAEKAVKSAVGFAVSLFILLEV